MSDLPKRLRIKASMIALGERIAWGSDTALMEEAADVIEALSASVENHQLHMLGMARDRDQFRAMLAAAPAQPAAQGQGEVQRLQIALRLSANRFDRLALEFPDAPDMRWTASEWANEARSAIAASAGQEVGK